MTTNTYAHSDSTSHFYGRWVTSSTHRSVSTANDRSRSTTALLYPTTPSLYPTPLSQGASWAPSGLNDEVDATTTLVLRENDFDRGEHHRRLIDFGERMMPSATAPFAEKSAGVQLHEMLAQLDGPSIHELYCMFVSPGVRLACSEEGSTADDPWRDDGGNSSDRGVSVAISDDLFYVADRDATSPRPPPPPPALVSARIVTVAEDRFMHDALSEELPLLAVSCEEQHPPLAEFEQRRRIVLEDHEREARLDVLQFEVRQRSLAKHLSLSFGEITKK